MAINAQLADHGIGIVGLPRDEAVDVAILERGQQWRPERSEAHHLDLALVHVVLLEQSAEHDVDCSVRRRSQRFSLQVLPGLHLVLYLRSENKAAWRHIDP